MLEKRVAEGIFPGAVALVDRAGDVEVAAVGSAEPWNVPGRYGWVGGTGTAAHIVPATGTVTILLTPCGLPGPAFPSWMRDFWTYAVTA
ncbi:hypothetical protein [Streptomyces sp. NBC_01340]|uniref:hypothetical protein n=1 Tax=Streptomyces sp. NBC_01340 TaxID=2903830 RepID=UPI003DA35D41